MTKNYWCQGKCLSCFSGSGCNKNHKNKKNRVGSFSIKILYLILFGSCCNDYVLNWKSIVGSIREDLGQFEHSCSVDAKLIIKDIEGGTNEHLQS